MSKYATLIAQIAANIRRNGAQAITGDLLQEQLLAMITSLGEYYQFGGLASPSAEFTPGDEPVVFVAATPGTYTNFGGLVVADGEVALLVWSGSAWSKQTTDIATRSEVSQLGQQVEDLIKGVIDNDFSISDEDGYIIARFKNGEIETKEFSSAKTPKEETIADTFCITDDNKNILASFEDGGIKTKHFDSKGFYELPLYGISTKRNRLAVIGDSIGDGATTTSQARQFRSILAKKLGMSCNYNVSHGSWSYGDPKESASQEIADAAQQGTTFGMLHTLLDAGLVGDERLIIMQGGTNDHGESIPLGVPFTEEDITFNGYARKLRKPSYDTTTTCGGLNTCIKKIYSILGYVNIVFMLPLKKNFTNQNMYEDSVFTSSAPYYDTPMSDMKNYAGYFLQDYQDAIETIAEFWGCHIIRANEMDLNPIVGNTKARYFNEGIHPNDAGHNILASFLFKDIVNNVFAGTTIIGYVRDGNGVPVSNANVILSGANGENINNNSGWSFTTDANGYFCIPNIPFFEFTARITATDGVTTKTADIVLLNKVQSVTINL